MQTNDSSVICLCGRLVKSHAEGKQNLDPNLIQTQNLQMVGKHVRVFQREHIRVTPMDVHVVMRLAYYNRYN